MIPPIRRQPVPLECATPPGPARPRTSKSGPARPGRTSGIASDLTPHHPLRADPPPLNHILMRKTHSVAGSPDSGPSSFASAYSSRTRTSHLRARGESGESRRDPGTGETPGTGLGAEILPRLRSRGPGGVMGIDTGTDMVVRALPRARRGHRGERQARRGYPGGRRTRRPTRGRPPRPTRGRWLSKSATKTPTEPERARRNVDIPRLRSPSIPPQGAFVADSDTPPPRVTTGAAPAPSFQRPAATNPSKEQRRPASGSPYQGSPARIIDVRSPSTRRPGPDAVQRARGVRCRCCCRPTLGSGGWSCRRRGRRRRPGARPSAGRTHRRAPE